MKFWWTIEKQKDRIVDKILKRSKLCLYSVYTGKPYITGMYHNVTEKYNPCSGKLTMTSHNIGVCIYGPRDHEHDFPYAYIDRHGKITSTRYQILETKDGRKYLK